ncbi:ATP-binding protein [Piscinibacter sp. HJYY11]|uniref:sensor histidine kinase n=1 Tax=Piscinibacter sp. HJYY11 TaxID=2801333 RepID=UPI00191F9AAC|nr:HAMP domain-containing sensor histidine kinase [Piscinibacter sp. HJYY11]MBL0728788.1 HAMP domain-containing histidine kinase [Piscinibacter sp. HJYY11]
MQTNEVYALAGALTTGMLAVLHFVVWRRQREPWSACFAISYLLICVIYAFDRHLQPAGDQAHSQARVGALLAVLLFTVGFVRYVNVPELAARRITLLASAVTLALLAVAWLGWVGRLGMFTGFAGFLAFQGLLALWAARREPGHGHGLVFLAMMLYPGVLVAAWMGLIEVSSLRYAVIVPVVVSGTTVLTTGLLRAQRRAAQELLRRQQAEAALQSLNETLEQRVAQRTAELREMVAGLESFNRSVSHDLRGPLGGIAGVSRLASEALGRHDLATVERLLSVITSQADSSGQLVNDLLALARVNDAQLALQPIDLHTFVQDTLEQIRLAQPDGRPLPVNVGPLPTVEADPGLLRQVYVNLLGNALKFSREAQPPQVEVGAFVQEGEQVCFVRDNGVGFDAAEAERLFQPFHRLHGQRFPGHGVGLSIVKRIVERHGGRLWAQAGRQQGATFFFSLPSHH